MISSYLPNFIKIHQAVLEKKFKYESVQTDDYDDDDGISGGIWHFS